jgi:hypothetical protein
VAVADREAAIKLMLEYGYGRPKQQVTLELDISVYHHMTDAELAERAEAMARRLRADSAPRLPAATDGEVVE